MAVPSAADMMVSVLSLSSYVHVVKEAHPTDLIYDFKWRPSATSLRSHIHPQHDEVDATSLLFQNQLRVTTSTFRLDRHKANKSENIEAFRMHCRRDIHRSYRWCVQFSATQSRTGHWGNHCADRPLETYRMTAVVRPLPGGASVMVRYCPSLSQVSCHISIASGSKGNNTMLCTQLEAPNDKSSILQVLIPDQQQQHRGPRVGQSHCPCGNPTSSTTPLSLDTTFAFPTLIFMHHTIVPHHQPQPSYQNTSHHHQLSALSTDPASSLPPCVRKVQPAETSRKPFLTANSSTSSPSTSLRMFSLSPGHHPHDQMSHATWP